MNKLLLPSEILEDIFSYLEYNDVLQCQLTCKWWSGQATQRILYKNIDMLMKGNDKLNSFIDAISKSTCGEYVRFLDVNTLFSKQYLTEEMMHTIGKHCPNVERIIGYDTNDLFCTCIILGRKLGYWQHIKQLPGLSFISDYTPEIYYESVFSCSNSLRTLDLCVERSECEVAKKIINKIHLFSRLETIRIRQTMRDVQEGISRFDEIISQCSKSVNKLFIVHCNDNQSNLTPKTNLKVLPRDNIKHLEIEYCDLNQDSMEYIIQKFPCIKELNIESSSEGIIKLPNTLIRDFFQYVSIIPKFKMLGVTSFEGEILCIALVSFIVSATRKSKKHCIINANISYHHDRSTQFTSIISNLDILHSEKENHKESSVIDISLEFFSRRRYLPRSRRVLNDGLWKMCGSGLTRINLCPSIQVSNDKPTHDYKISKGGIGTILKYCKSLVELEIGQTNISYNALEDPIVINKVIANTSISILKLNYCWFPPSVLTALSVRLPSLAHLTIHNCVFVNTGICHEIAYINMPHIFFQSLYLSWSHEYSDVWKSFDLFHTKIALPGEIDQFFYISQNNIQKVTDLKEVINKLEFAPCVINIDCKDIYLFSIKIDEQAEMVYNLKY